MRARSLSRAADSADTAATAVAASYLSGIFQKHVSLSSWAFFASDVIFMQEPPVLI